LTDKQTDRCAPGKIPAAETTGKRP